MKSKQVDVPERGDVIWISLDPQAGHEQRGRRPALVLSPAAYNGRVGLALLCPITNQAKGYPFEVALPEGLDVTGVILADRINSVSNSSTLRPSTSASAVRITRCRRAGSASCTTSSGTA